MTRESRRGAVARKSLQGGGGHHGKATLASRSDRVVCSVGSADVDRGVQNNVHSNRAAANIGDSTCEYGNYNAITNTITNVITSSKDKDVGDILD